MDDLRLGLADLDRLIDVVACATLVLVAMEDLRRYRIRNSAVIGLAGLFGLACLVSGNIGPVLWHGLFGGIVLVAMAAAYGLGLVGAGDAKLMTVACLWVGPEGALVFALVLSLITLLYCLGVKLWILPVRRDGTRSKIPFAPSIAGAWIATIAVASL